MCPSSLPTQNVSLSLGGKSKDVTVAISSFFTDEDEKVSVERVDKVAGEAAGRFSSKDS